jgi:hypothetical protein
MPKLVTRAELARIAGISAMSVTRACRTRLADACIGLRLDLDHPVAAAYLAEKRGAPTTRAEPAHSPPPAPTPPSPPAPVPPVPRVPRVPPVASAAAPPPASPLLPNSWDRVEVEQYADWTLRQISDQFGTVTAFKDWLDARKKQVSVREKELKNWEAEGMLIPRDAVRTHVFGHIEGVNRRLLQDVPKTIARRVYALARSDTPVEDAERLVREILSSELRPMKERVARTLREAR